MSQSTRGQHWTLTLLTTLALLCGMGVILILQHHPTGIDDALRHLAMARLLREHGVASVSGWGEFLYRGYFSIVDSDPWFLFHLLLTPLASLPVMEAQRIIILTSLALLLISFSTLLRSEGLSPRLTSLSLLLLTFGNATFTFRLLLARPFTLITSVMFLTFLAVLRERWIVLGILICFSVLLSHLFVFPLTVAAITGAWLLLLGKSRAALRLSSAVILGLAGGFLLHPRPLPYARYLTEVFLRIPFLQQLDLGSELRTGLVSNSAIEVPIALIVLLIIMGVNEGVRWRDVLQRSIAPTAALAFLSINAYLFWTRAIDFLWPFLLLFPMQLVHLKPTILQRLRADLPPFLTRHATLLLVLFCATNATFVGVTATMADARRNLAQFAAIAPLPPGSRVLNLHWDLFPALVSLRPDLRYARGMDPSFDFLVDPEASALLQAATTALLPQGPPTPGDGEWLRPLLARYGADYIVFDRSRSKHLLLPLRASPLLHEVSREEGLLAVFRVLR